MTYCVATMINAGIVFASDSRTNAGVDNVATFSKMKRFELPGERVIVTMNSGNLAVSQAVVNYLEQCIRRNDGMHLMNVQSMYEVAELIGNAIREIRHRDGPFLMEHHIDGSVNFIVGGQIVGEEQRLFMVYSEGNFIEATPETSYFQIGEVKYGKPIIDRVIRAETSLDDVIKCLLVSFDSTMHSNLSVGMPIDMLCYERGSLNANQVYRFAEQDPYVMALRQSWSDGVRAAFAQLPVLAR